MMVCKLSAGDEVHRYQKSVVVHFVGRRKVLSTAHINGGYQEDLKAVFNHDVNLGPGMACGLRADTYLEHMQLIAREIGLDPDTVAGISTAASMENLAIRSASFQDFTVTALVTGGIEVNGGRVGDPASYHEEKGKSVKVQEGTINILLFIDANLPGETMARALVTCTEAKTAALQELMAGSKYSTGIATGSGTDGTIVFCNADSPTELMFAGKHSKLGEYIGKTVKEAVKEALFLQTGLSPQSQHSTLRRISRYHIHEDSLWERYLDSPKAAVSKAKFLETLERVEKDPRLVTKTSLLVHLLDQYDWGLLPFDEVKEEAWNVMEGIRKSYGLKEMAELESEETREEAQMATVEKEDAIALMIQEFERLLVDIVRGLIHV